MSLAFDVRAAAPTPTTKVRAQDLAGVLDAHPEFRGIKVLSLDCFDTLLWRSTASPIDVFYDLGEAPAFAKIGMNAKLRVMSELKARDLKAARTGRTEVNLGEIYRAGFPDLDDAAVAELIDAEIAAEIAACSPLPDTVALIRRAKEKGLRIVIVSDTYLVERELRRLLAATIPADAYAAIDEVFCSAVYGRAKADGLLKPVFDELRVRARDVLHIGDNPVADLAAAKAIGANALHLFHHGEDTAELLRMQTTAASLLLPGIREDRSLPNPYRGVLARSALSRADKATAVDTLGYASLGPVLFAFTRWLESEMSELRAQGKSPKPVFLLRDGYLPHRIAGALGGDVGPCVAMSRFAAFAASFRSAADVEQYVAMWAGSKRFAAVARQLLLTEEEGKVLVAKVRKSDRPAEAFFREVTKPKTLATILARSKAYRTRMFRYLEKTAGIARGDTLVFIDLGYEGTAQRQLEPVLRDELGVELLGRYLIAARVPGWEHSRKGLLDPSWCDDRLISTLVTYIALLENLCASAEGSTVDFTEEGEAVQAAVLVSDDQSARAKPVQDACERFARDAAAYFDETGRPPSIAMMRGTAVACLARMLLLSTRGELDYLAGFSLDLNLGVADKLALFDCEKGLQGLRRQGLFFVGSESQERGRIAGPVELRAASLELSLTMVAQQRFGLEMTPNDMSHRREPLGILAMRGNVPVRATAEARATHDGWFAVHVPMDASAPAVGLAFGERYAWVQVESITRIEASALYTTREADASEDIGRHLHAEGMTQKAPGLFECPSAEGFLLVAPPPPASPAGRYVCRVVFRPIAPRSES